MAFIKTGLELTYTPLGPNGEELVFYNGLYSLQSEVITPELRAAVDAGAELGFGYIWDKIGAIGNALRERRIKVWTVDSDPGVIEIPTLPRTKLSTLLNDIKRIGAAVNSVCPSVPHHRFFTGGGCHINMQVPECDRSVRPYDDFDDFDNAAHNLSSPSVLMVKFMTFHPGACWAFAHPGAYQGFHVWGGVGIDSKDAAMSLNTEGRSLERIEFRFFRMPDTLQEHIDAIEYAQAVYKFVMKNQNLVRAILRETGKPSMRAYREEGGEKLALASYHTVLRLIGLDTPRFRAYDKNIKGRYYYHRQCPRINYIA